MKTLDREWLGLLARDPLYWLEAFFMVLGLILIIFSFRTCPVNLYFISLGIMNYLFSLIVRKKRLKSYRDKGII